MNKNFQYKQQR